MINFLANLLTTASLFCGFVSVILSLENHFTFSAWAIILSVVFDGLDGQVARLNPIPSGFGEELDSLVDVVSFGIAPSILGYVFIYKDFYAWAVTALFVYLVCSVFRLAKYNITPKEKMRNYFIGLPTTMSGGILASFILIYRKQDHLQIPEFMPGILSARFTPIIFVVLVLLLAYLMVSRIRYLNLDGLKRFLGRKTIPAVLFLLSILVLAAFYRKAGITLFTYFLIYLLFSPFVVKRLGTQK